MVCAVLLCFPGGIPHSAADFAFPALFSGVIALGLSHSLLKLGRLPVILRIGILLPIAFSVPLTLLVLPHPLVELWVLIPIALILLSLRSRFPALSGIWIFLAFWICLSLGSAGWLQVLQTRPNAGLPRLPNHLGIWLGILAVIPLGFATRPRLFPLAKLIARCQIWTAFVLLGLYPLIWCAATSFKIPGEPARTFHALRPQPRFFLRTSNEIPDLLPPEFRDRPYTNEMLHTLNEMSWRLTDPYLNTTFSDTGDLKPEVLVRSMKLYGFLLEDRYGAFLPGGSFERDAPEEMDPQFLPDFRTTMSKIVLSPKELAWNLMIPLPEAQQVFNQLEDLNLVREVPGTDLRYRLTSQARRPFANGLFPRQLLLIEQAAPDSPTEIVAGNYVPRRKLPQSQIFSELYQLVDLGAAETRPVWQWNQHTRFLLDPQRWKYTCLLAVLAILALLAGRSLPDRLSKPQFVLLILAGAGLSLHWPFALDFQPALRIGLGLWIARNLISLNERECDRVSLFAACGFITAAIMPLPEETLLIHQCAWVMIWTLPALVFLSFAIRPMKKIDNPQ